jgi:ATP-dependent helicase/nuclease subunit A
MSAHIRFISAGAGSGKTYRLTELLLAELQAGRVRPAGVLATTFTKRAATELRERVRGFLISQGEFTRADAVGSARIGTVNSVCGSLLQRFAFEAGLPTEQRVLDEARAGQLLREAVDTVIEGHALSELLQVARRLSLDADPRGGKPPWQDALGKLVDQARANAIDAELLRGFGTANADNLLSHFPAPAKMDLDARLAAALAAAIPGVTQSLQDNAQKNTKEYLDLLVSAQRDLAQHTLAWSAWNKLTVCGSAKVKTLAEPVMEAAAMLASHAGLHADLRRYLELMFALAADTLDAYASAKRQIGALDFTDQERLLLDVLDHPFVASTLGEELDLLMVDEFQDTSPIQLALFLKLARYARQVVWVGDIKQAIYGFRGSDTALMRSVIEALPKLGGTKEVLAHSWRSRPALVEFVNHVFATRFEGLAASEVTLSAKRPEIDGTVAIADWLIEGNNAETRNQALAAGIQRLLASGSQIMDPKSEQLRAVRAADIAILARANDTVKDIAAALEAAGIASATQQPGLLGEPEVVLALACIRRLNDDGDTLATAEIVSLADCAEPETWLVDRLEWLAAGEAHGEWKERAIAGHEPQVILETLRSLRDQAAVLTPREAVELVIARCGLARRVVQWQQGADRARVRLANLDRVIGLAQQYEDECLSGRDAASLSGLLLWLQDLQANELDTKALPAVDAVQVMTHHAAKGLEWPVVVLCDLASDVRDRLWGVQTESLAAFDVDRPLHRRFVRYWPWAFGAQKKVDDRRRDRLLAGRASGARRCGRGEQAPPLRQHDPRTRPVGLRAAGQEADRRVDGFGRPRRYLAQRGPKHHRAARRHGRSVRALGACSRGVVRCCGCGRQRPVVVRARRQAAGAPTPEGEPVIADRRYRAHRRDRTDRTTHRYRLFGRPLASRRGHPRLHRRRSGDTFEAARLDRSGRDPEADASRRRCGRCSAPPPTGRPAFVAGNPLARCDPRGRTPCRASYVRRAACARSDRSCVAHIYRLDPDGSQVHAAGARPVG